MEEWREISGFHYSVSNMGRVRNDWTRRILKPRENGYGYFHIGLYRNKTQKTFKIHRLVAMSFISNPLNLPQINHKNLIKTDNRVDNLEWCTPSENTRHAYKNGRVGIIGQTWTRGSGCGMAKLIDKQVLEIRRLYATGNYFLRELAEKFNVKLCTIHFIVKNKTWKYI